MVPEPLIPQVPAAYKHARVEHFPAQSIKLEGSPSDGADLLHIAGKHNLYVFGMNGRGKTHLAAALAISIGHQWRDWPLVVLDLRATFRPGSEMTQRGVLRSLIDVPKLVLDDVFRGSNHDFSLDSLLIVVDQRMREARPTIVTSHLLLETVHSIDSHLASRFSRWKQVAVRGDDRNAIR